MTPSPKRAVVSCALVAVLGLLSAGGEARAESTRDESRPAVEPTAEAPGSRSSASDAPAQPTDAVPTDEASSAPAAPTDEASSAPAAPTDEASSAPAAPTDEASSAPAAPTDEASSAPTDEASSAPADTAEERIEAEAEAEEDRRISAKVADAVAREIDRSLPVRASYTEKGFRLETRDGNWQTNLQWRAQFRLTYPFVGDPRQVPDFNRDNYSTTFEVRRLRMKIGGFGYRPWLKYYFELDLEPSRDVDDSEPSSSARLLDWRVDVARFEKVGLRIGQWKIDYTRERVESSSRQEFVERSIVNRIFTIDRQVGLQLRGRLFNGTPADFRYYAGVFTGEGRGVTNDDNNLLYAGRVQWNMLGRDVPLSQTDVQRTPKPAAALGVGSAYNIGRCTRWSSSGCGNLDGFEPPEDAAEGQYKIKQVGQDFAFRWQGFAIQQEFQWKNIDDRVNDRDYNLWGAYAQVGYFFSGLWDWFPRPLEFAYRYGWVKEPNESDLSVDNKRQEFTAAANWFFFGHNNKLTLDYSYLTLDDPINGDPTANRVRFQWDISF